MPVFRAEKLQKIGETILEAAGTPPDEAKQTVEFLVKSNLCGHDSHGVIRIPEYVSEILTGSCKPAGKIKIVRESPVTALIDGNWGLGQVVAVRTMNLAIDKAAKLGIGAVATFNCCHIGRMADYAMMAVSHDMIGLCTVNARAGVAPYGGKERMLNQGPVAIAIPAGQEPSFVLDISTSVCAGGKIMHALDKHQKLPEGYIIDKEGNPTTDPKDYINGGACLPLGGPVAYKGYGLSMVIDIIAGILSGRGPAYDHSKKGQGVFQTAVKIDAFQPIDEFKAEMDKMMVAIKSSNKAPGFKEILVPGEVELRSEKENLSKGINIPEETWKKIVETALKVGVDTEELLKS